MSDPFAIMTATVLDTPGIGFDATVQRGAAPAVPVRVSKRDEVDRFGETASIATRERVIGFHRETWLPKRGDVLTLDGEGPRIVEAIVSDDGYLVEVMLDA